MHWASSTKKSNPYRCFMGLHAWKSRGRVDFKSSLTQCLYPNHFSVILLTLLPFLNWLPPGRYQDGYNSFSELGINAWQCPGEKRDNFFQWPTFKSEGKSFQQFPLIPHWSQLATFLNPWGKRNELMGIGLGVYV